MLFLKVGATGDQRPFSCAIMALAKALKLSFAVCRIGERRPNPDWRFMSIEDGRNYYRQMIEEAVAEVLARKVAKNENQNCNV
jgi:hypothetical protein